MNMGHGHTHKRTDGHTHGHTRTFYTKEWKKEKRNYCNDKHSDSLAGAQQKHLWQHFRLPVFFWFEATNFRHLDLKIFMCFCRSSETVRSETFAYRHFQVSACHSSSWTTKGHSHRRPKAPSGSALLIALGHCLFGK